MEQSQKEYQKIYQKKYRAKKENKEKAKAYQAEYRDSSSGQIGRNPKKIKLKTNVPATLGVISYPSKDFYLDIVLNRNFKSIEQLKLLTSKIKCECKEFSKNFNDNSEHMRPIIVINDLTKAAIERTNKNQLKIELVVYLDKIIHHINEIDKDKIESFVEEISVL